VILGTLAEVQLENANHESRVPTLVLRSWHGIETYPDLKTRQPHTWKALFTQQHNAVVSFYSTAWIARCGERGELDWQQIISCSGGIGGEG
jgi:hypothetical protein